MLSRMGDEIAGYAHVNLVVTDIEAATEFYEGKLGLERLPRPDFGSFGGTWYRLGPSQLHLSVVEQMPDWNGGAPHLALYIEQSRFVDTVGRLKDAGVEMVSDV